MRKILLIALFSLLVLGGFQLAAAADCVEVDIELPATIVAEPGVFADGSIVLTNCGDAAATATVNIDVHMVYDVDLGDEQYADTIDFDLDFDVPVEAGETLTREFTFPVATFSGEATATVCVTATIGEAVAEDCAETYIEGNNPADRERTRQGCKHFNFQFTGEGCVEVALELPDTVYAGNHNQGQWYSTGYFELTNCADEPAQIMLVVEADLNIGDFVDTSIIFPERPVVVGAGETVSKEFRFHTPPFDGEYTICITATSGEAVAVSCQTMVVAGAEFPGITWSACGTLVQGTECVLFRPHCSDTKAFVLDNYGDFEVGDSVCVSGTLVPQCETDCVDATCCIVDNTIDVWECTGCQNDGQPIEACGVLVEGTACTLFAVFGNSQMVLLLDDYGDYVVGDTVRVAGTIFCNCDASACPDAMGCVVENTITDCTSTTTDLVTENYPNPFNPSTQILFTLPSSGQVNVTVYNLLGQQIRTLVDGEMPAGEHQVIWDGTNADGQKVASGIYLYKVEAGDYRATKKMVLAK